MINSEFINNGLGNSGTGMPTCHKQPPSATKKVVLRDVQNDNRSLIRNGQESLPFVDGKPIVDAIKVCGTKRLVPEYPSTHTCPPPLSNNGANEHLMYARRKFESDQAKGKIQDSTDQYADCPQPRYFCHMQRDILQKQTQMKESNACLPVVTANHTSSMMAFSYGASSLPNSLGKLGNGLRAAEHDCFKVNSGIPHSIDSKGYNDQQRKERFTCLQNYLKHCNESNKRDYAQMLLHLSPADLSRHAVELEKRAIQLTIEEGKEIQRMKALNILGKSVATNNPLEMSQQLHSKK